MILGKIQISERPLRVPAAWDRIEKEWIELDLWSCDICLKSMYSHNISITLSNFPNMELINSMINTHPQPPKFVKNSTVCPNLWKLEIFWFFLSQIISERFSREKSNFHNYHKFSSFHCILMKSFLGHNALWMT